MRKGTHSCLECRQRKIRCVSGPNARKCNGCSVKELRCTDQELYRSRSPKSGERKSTRDQVHRLEGMLDQVLRNQSRINEDSNSYTPDLGRNESTPLEKIHVADEGFSATDFEDSVSRKRRKVDVLASNGPDAYVPKIRNYGDEPFLELFEDIDHGKRRDRNPQGNVRGGRAGLSVADESAHRILRDLRLQIPNSRELMSILQAGCSTMRLWSEAFPNALGAPEDLSLERLRDHIYRCLYSDNIADAAKLMLCLALHIQQLPTDLETTHINGLSDDLQEHYMTSAESLLASDEGLGGTLNGLECMILQSEFYINVGALRKVWLIIRRAINLAQLLGLHRMIDADVESRLAMRRKAIWAELWLRERGFSLILGLPCSTLESQTPRLTPDNDVSDVQRLKRFTRDLGIVMGYISDRDQDPSGKPYSITLKIEEELEECQSIMSAQWWEFTPGPATPIDAICSMFVAKMRFYIVQRLLHLPFLLKASGDRKYEGSRLSALKSSREIISVYNVLRDEKRPVFKLCDMVDFQVFAAAMTLVVDLLACSRSQDRYDQHREECDWQLVLQTAVGLGRLSQSMRGCDVAALGARVLEDFSKLRNASAEGLAKVDIPYFGRIEIRRRDTRHCEYASSPQPSSLMNHHTQSQQDSASAFEGSVESMLSVDSYLFPMPATSQPWQADESWTHLLDSTLADDWSWFPCGDPT